MIDNPNPNGQYEYVGRRIFTEEQDEIIENASNSNVPLNFVLICNQWKGMFFHENTFNAIPGLEADTWMATIQGSGIEALILGDLLDLEYRESRETTFAFSYAFHMCAVKMYLENNNRRLVCCAEVRAASEEYLIVSNWYELMWELDAVKAELKANQPADHQKEPEIGELIVGLQRKRREEDGELTTAEIEQCLLYINKPEIIATCADLVELALLQEERALGFVYMTLGKVRDMIYNWYGDFSGKLPSKRTDTIIRDVERAFARRGLN
jgi:hypothetical protein